MPKIDIEAIQEANSTSYPAPFRELVKGRFRKALGNAGGLTQFGVNLCRLSPGAATAQRHWHEKEDEFAYVISGELALIEDGGEVTLRPGDCAAWKAGVRDGHHLINRSASQPATFLVVGTRDSTDWGEYPDIDLKFNPARYEPAAGAGASYSHKDGTPY
jgi:uncharacterized cupin superfamily protein